MPGNSAPAQNGEDPSGLHFTSVANPDRFDANAGVGAEASAVLLGCATGDLEAQRCMRDEWFAGLGNRENPAPDSDLVDAGGLLVARLCAAHGDRDDVFMLALALSEVGIRHHYRGRDAVAWRCVIEAFSLYERLGDAGDTIAVQAVKGLLDLLPIEVVAQAKECTLQGKTDGTPAAPACIRAVH